MKNRASDRRGYGKRISLRAKREIKRRIKRRIKRLLTVTAAVAGILLAVSVLFGTVHKTSVNAEKLTESKPQLDQKELSKAELEANKQQKTESQASKGFLVREEKDLFEKMAEKMAWEQYKQDFAAYMENHKVTFQTVEESYFDHTLFIGDSRTLGLSQFARLGKADYFSEAGMTVFSLFKEKVSDLNFGLTDLRTLLSRRSYERIYLMLGINEIGYPMEGIKKQYKAVLDEIRAIQPNADIILQANMKVARKKEKANKNFAVANINTLNQIIASFADQKHIYYIDINGFDEFVDEEGYLKDEISADGVHPNVSYYQSWAQWLCENAV